MALKNKDCVFRIGNYRYTHNHSIFQIKQIVLFLQSFLNSVKPEFLSAKIDLRRVYSNKPAQLRKIKLSSHLIYHDSSDIFLYAKRED